MRLKSGHFSEAEKQLIRENWKVFASDHGLAHNEIFRLTMAQRGDRDANRRKHAFVKDSALWAKLCRGLENRAAFAVRCVIPNVFGLKNAPNFHPAQFLADAKQRSLFMHYRQKFEDDRTLMSMSLDISANQIGHLFKIVMHMNEPIQGHALVRMWRYIPFCCHSTGAKVAFENGRAVTLIAWSKLGFLTKRMPVTCQKTFKEIYPKVCVLMRDGLSADAAIVKVSGCSQPCIQAHDLCSFVRIVHGELDSSSYSDAVLHYRFDHVRQRVRQEMERLGVFGFYTGKGTPFSHCRSRLMRLICNIRKLILPRLTVIYTLKDLLTVVIRTLEDYYMSGEAENEMEEEEQGGADRAARGAVKKLNGIRVATGDLVAHLFLYTREEICEDFVPPWKFKQIVPARFSSVLAMFDETRKNEFYISSTDVNKKKKLIRESTAVQREREGEVEDLLKEEEDGESTDEEELVRVCSGEKKEKGGAKEKTSVQKTTPTGEEVIVFVKNKKLREEKDQMEQKKMEDVSVEERKKRKKEKKEKRRLEEQREQEETEMEQDAVEKKRRKKEKKDRKRLLQMEQEEEEREKKGHKKGKEEAEE